MGVKDAVCFIRENPFGQKFIPWIFLFFSAFSQPSQLVGLYALAVALAGALAATIDRGQSYDVESWSACRAGVVIPTRLPRGSESSRRGRRCRIGQAGEYAYGRTQPLRCHH